MPQFIALVRVSTSQPSLSMRLQSAYPALQLAMRHIPPSQVAVAFARAGQGRSQPPQCKTWVSVSTQLVPQSV
jgi:hypothetical protein